MSMMSLVLRRPSHYPRHEPRLGLRVEQQAAQPDSANDPPRRSPLPRSADVKNDRSVRPCRSPPPFWVTAEWTNRMQRLLDNHLVLTVLGRDGRAWTELNIEWALARRTTTPSPELARAPGFGVCGRRSTSGWKWSVSVYMSPELEADKYFLLPPFVFGLSAYTRMG
ncbi:unnamed protein product [Cyclocybe aegerita]|uniref:Uncharacterized protein n=1 Tax=Cyclocybe aegerita TaxID=1973307 RepID=A0A8S0XF86_CYCAE|nr:unnamed protein product [Cyclocybe aegerita]